MTNTRRVLNEKCCKDKFVPFDSLKHVNILEDDMDKISTWIKLCSTANVIFKFSLFYSGRITGNSSLVL